jgi:hypothetical protein
MNAIKTTSTILFGTALILMGAGAIATALFPDTDEFVYKAKDTWTKATEADVL